MATTWSNFNNGDTGATIRSALNAFNTGISGDVTSLENSVGSLGNTVAGNTNDISNNTANIGVNTNNISVLAGENITQDGRLDALEAVNLGYAYNKVAGASTVSNVYSPLNSLLLPNAPAGIYEYKFSMTYNYNATTRSSFFRFTVDGGVSWNEMRREPKDGTDNVPLFYAFPYAHVGGDIDLRVEYRCENNGDTLNVQFIDIVAERKL